MITVYHSNSIHYSSDIIITRLLLHSREKSTNDRSGLVCREGQMRGNQDPGGEGMAAEPGNEAHHG